MLVYTLSKASKTIMTEKESSLYQEEKFGLSIQAGIWIPHCCDPHFNQHDSDECWVLRRGLWNVKEWQWGFWNWSQPSGLMCRRIWPVFLPSLRHDETVAEGTTRRWLPPAISLLWKSSGKTSVATAARQVCYSNFIVVFRNKGSSISERWRSTFLIFWLKWQLRLADANVSNDHNQATKTSNFALGSYCHCFSPQSPVALQTAIAS